MNKGDEFFELISPIEINSAMDNETIIKQLQPLCDWLFCNTPQKLYRFFSGNERSIEQFKNNEVWGSRASTFNDPFECMPSFDVEKINNDLMRVIDIEMIKKFVEAVKNGYRLPQMNSMSKSLMDSILSFISQPDFDKRLEDNIHLIKEQFFLWWRSVAEGTYDSFFKIFFYQRNQEYITCFTENLDATLMWAHYANSHKGFCLEYNWKERLLSQPSGFLIDNKAYLCPVKYSDKRFDATSYIYTILDNYIKEQTGVDFELYFRDILTSIKALLTKSIDWSYEKEWRMFSYEQNAKPEIDYKIQLIQKPTAVYLGARMPQQQADMIEQICLEKEIPCYKMLQTYGDNRFVVEPELYSGFKEKINSKLMKEVQV